MRSARAIVPIVAMLCCIAMSCKRDAVRHAAASTCASSQFVADQAVTGRAQPTNAIAVDIYVDATDSMIGYVNVPNGAYSSLLSRLEAAVNQGWNKAALQYFKFGKATVPITREEYIEGTKTAAFYRDPRTHLATNIELAIEKAANDRVTIVITDLFQDKSDVNRLVSTVKERCFRQGIDVGIAAVPVAFEGTVFDAPVGSYSYKSTDDPGTFRPFYLLLFGDAGNLLKLVEKLQSMHAIPPERFFLISDHIVDEYSVALRKQRESDALVPLGSVKADVFSFRVKKSKKPSDGGSFDLCATIRRKPGAPLIAADGVQLVAEKGMPPEEFRLRSLQQDGDAFRAVVDYDTRRAKGQYDYMLMLAAGNTSLKVPSWVTALSSANPRKEADGNRTLNLDLLVTGLLDAKTTMSPPLLAKFEIKMDRK